MTGRSAARWEVLPSTASRTGRFIRPTRCCGRADSGHSRGTGATQRRRAGASACSTDVRPSRLDGRRGAAVPGVRSRRGATRCTPVTCCSSSSGCVVVSCLGFGGRTWTSRRTGHASGWQLQRVDGQLVLRQTKTVVVRAPFCPLPDICVDALYRPREMTNRWRLAAGEAWHDHDLVLSTRFGMPIDPRNFHRKFKERATAAAVPVVPVHSTRRTCASLLVELDVHPRVAMQILRHSQIAVTMDIYSQVASASTRAALSKLGSRLDLGHG